MEEQQSTSKINVALTVMGLILVVIALILFILKKNHVIAYVIFTIGVLLEIIYRIKRIAEKRKNNEKTVRDILSVIIYAAFIVAIWAL